MLKSFRFEPVRWMTGALAILTALIAANELVHDISGRDIVPAGATPYLLFGEVLLALLLGGAVRSRVTPLARPRDDADVPLVPNVMVGPGPSVRRASDIGPAGMSGW